MENTMTVMENTMTVMEVNGVREIITTTEEHAQELVNDIMSNNRKGVNLFVDNCEKLAELRATKGYLLLGYKSFYTDKDNEDSVVKYLLGEEISNGDTEAKNMCLLATTFGTKQYTEDGKSLDKWVIDERSKDIISYMSKGLLYELPALKECSETAQDIETLMGDLFGIEFNEDGCPIQKLPTVRAIREVKSLERQFKLPYSEALEAKAQLEAQAQDTEPTGEDTEPTGEPTGEDTEPTGEDTEPTGEPTGEDTEPTGEPTGEDTEPTGEDTEPTGEPTEDTEPTEKPVEVCTVSLKEAKQLLKVGYKLRLTNLETGEELVLIIQ